MILITRPKLEAKKLKKTIELIGHSVHVDSLSKVINYEFKNTIDLKKLIIISSQRAAKTFISSHAEKLKIPILVIGNTSYKKLKAAGFLNIIFQAKDSSQLLIYLKKNFSLFKKKYENKLIYVTGSVSNKKFIKKLIKLEYRVEKKIVYKTVFKRSFNNSTVQLLKKNKINICLIYSQQNAVHFCKLIKKDDLFKKCENLLILTLSKNITKVMKKNGYINVANSSQPTQASLIKKLQKNILL